MSWSTSKKKPTKSFSFVNRSNQEMADYLNFLYPIDLRGNHDLLDRVAERLPNIKKKDIEMVIRMIFRCFRDHLVLGHIINFRNMFEDFKLSFWSRRMYKHILRRLDVQVITPEHLRHIELEDTMELKDE
jgi:nucleoid DNA-binding protein